MTDWNQEARPSYGPRLGTVKGKPAYWWAKVADLLRRITNVYFGMANEYITRPRKHVAFYNGFFLLAHGVFAVFVKLPLMVAYWLTYAVVVIVLITVIAILGIGHIFRLPFIAVGKWRATIPNGVVSPDDAKRRGL